MACPRVPPPFPTLPTSLSLAPAPLLFLPPFPSTPGRLPTSSRPAVPGVCWSPYARPARPPRWSCPSRSPWQARLSVRPACAVAPSVLATSRASGWGLMASWGLRSARPLPRRSPPSPRLCTTSLGSAGRGPQGCSVWGGRPVLGFGPTPLWNPAWVPNGEASQTQPASRLRTELCCSHPPGDLFLAATILWRPSSPPPPCCLPNLGSNLHHFAPGRGS